MISGRTDRNGIAVAGTALAAYAAFAVIFLAYLPAADGMVGSDYGYFMPQLLAGFFWYQVNGLTSMPWFTPAFCAGIPFFPNLQTIYLSLPQVLTFAMAPMPALQATFLIMAAAGFAGFYVLLRKTFHTGRWVALAGAVMFLFNGFFAYRFLIGHLAFHAFMLVPFVAVCALAGTTEGHGRRMLDGAVLAAALMVVYMVQSGMVHALPPSLLGIAAIMLVHALRFGASWRPFIRLGLACAIALVLSAGKLVAALAFMSEFPREMLPLTGFSSLSATLAIAVLSLFFLPAAGLGAEVVRNNQWFDNYSIFLATHEFEFGITVVPALLILIGGIMLLAKARRPEPGGRRGIAFCLGRISPSFETLAALALRMRKSADLPSSLTLRSRPPGLRSRSGRFGGVGKDGVSKGEAAICDNPGGGRGAWTRAVLWMGILAILVLPLPLNWYQPEWTEWLESLPYFGNSMTMIRWFSLYVLVLVLLAALVIERAALRPALKTLVCLLVVGLVVGLNATRDRSYYDGRMDYDVTTVGAAYASAVAAGAPPPVERIEWPKVGDYIDRMMKRDRNDSLTRGASQAECYEPLFGHRLEEFPFGRLREGPTLQARDGVLNVKNPACFLYPEANDCRPGDHFSVAQADEARDFLAYRPFPFVMPWWQRAANWLSIAGFAVVVAGLMAPLVGRRLERQHPHLRGSRPRRFGTQS